MRNRNNRIGIGRTAGKGRVEEGKASKGWEEDGGKVRGMVSTWHSVGTRGNYPQRLQ